MSKKLLEVKNLKQYFGSTRAVDDVSFDVYENEIYGLVGESGSGKSTTGRSIIGLYDITGGEIIFDGRVISDKRNRKNLAQEIQMIFQDPMACLNPRLKVKDIVAQGLRVNKLCRSESEIDEKVDKILEKVGLTLEQKHRYPHQFSGGQRQRIGVARALIMNPKLIIADEPISALDVSIQAQVINLMKDIAQEFKTTFLFIAHDLSMVKYISDRIGVLHLGRLLEEASSSQLFNNPIHPYTKALLSAIPLANPKVEKARKALEYDREELGIDYYAGSYHLVEDGHRVYGSAQEIEHWSQIGKDRLK